MKLSNKVYDTLKWVTMFLLPALAVFVPTLANIWGFPYGEEIQKTLIATVAFLGVVLQISSANFRADQNS
jgi:hypothetical protein